MLERRRVTAPRGRRKGEGKARRWGGKNDQEGAGGGRGLRVWRRGAVPAARAWPPLQRGPRCRGAAAQPPAPWVQTGGNEAALGFSGGVLHLVFPSKHFSAAVHPSLDVEFT